MKVIDHLAKFEKPAYSVVTIGTFDGVHVGHQTILRQIVSEARESQGKSTLITFWPHPRFILNKNPASLKLLTTFEEKVQMIAELGVDYVVKVAFTPEFSNLTALDFVKNVLVDGVGVKKLFIGYDHHFGNNREGNIEFLKKISNEFHFEVNEIPKQTIDHLAVSSTKIRNALHEGHVKLANSLLGRSYCLHGTVIDGDKRGRTIGFPTANIEVSESYKLLPADGSYAIRSKIKGKLYNGMLNIGFKPTVNGSKRTIEAHLFNFEQEIYGEFIEVEFVDMLRNELKFDSVDMLRQQLVLDKLNAIQLLSQ